MNFCFIVNYWKGINLEKLFMLPISIAATVDNIINEAIKTSPHIVTDYAYYGNNEKIYLKSEK